MAYYFMAEKPIKNPKEKYQKIDITKSKYFMRLSNLKKEAACRLQEIDCFTMMFNNEEELRIKLFEEGILDNSLVNRPLSIRYTKNDIYKKLPLDLLYQKDIEYIMDPQRLIREIFERDISNDFDFLESYARFFMKYRECDGTAPYLYNHALTSNTFASRCRRLDDIDEYGDLLSVKMTKQLIYKIGKSNGKRYYKYDEIDYRNLHMIIAFINHYDNKLEKSITDDEVEEMIQPNMFEDTSYLVAESNIEDKETEQPKSDDMQYQIVPSKKRVKKKDPIPGQFSLFNE